MLPKIVSVTYLDPLDFKKIYIGEPIWYHVFHFHDISGMNICKVHFIEKLERGGEIEWRAFKK